MKGYHTSEGYKGYVPGMGYILFSCEQDYKEYYLEHTNGKEE